MTDTFANCPSRTDAPPDDARIQAAMAARSKQDAAMHSGYIETLDALFAEGLGVQTPSQRIVDGAKVLAVYAKVGQHVYNGGMTLVFDFVSMRSLGRDPGAVAMMGEETMPRPSGPPTPPDRPQPLHRHLARHRQGVETDLASGD